MGRYYRSPRYMPAQPDNSINLVTAILNMQAAKNTKTVMDQAAVDARAAGVTSAALKPLSDIVERMAVQASAAADQVKTSGLLSLVSGGGMGGGGGGGSMAWVLLATTGAL